MQIKNTLSETKNNICHFLLFLLSFYYEDCMVQMFGLLSYKLKMLHNKVLQRLTDHFLLSCCYFMMNKIFQFIRSLTFVSRLDLTGILGRKNYEVEWAGHEMSLYSEMRCSGKISLRASVDLFIVCAATPSCWNNFTRIFFFLSKNVFLWN